jgi:hypothetical protein
MTQRSAKKIIQAANLATNIDPSAPDAPFWTQYLLEPLVHPLTSEEEKRRRAPLNDRNRDFRLLR